MVYSSRRRKNEGALYECFYVTRIKEQLATSLSIGIFLWRGTSQSKSRLAKSIGQEKALHLAQMVFFRALSSCQKWKQLEEITIVTAGRVPSFILQRFKPWILLDPGQGIDHAVRLAVEAYNARFSLYEYEKSEKADMERSTFYQDVHQERHSLKQNGSKSTEIPDNRSYLLLPHPRRPTSLFVCMADLLNISVDLLEEVQGLLDESLEYVIVPTQDKGTAILALRPFIVPRTAYGPESSLNTHRLMQEEGYRGRIFSRTIHDLDTLEDLLDQWDTFNEEFTMSKGKKEVRR